MMHNEILSLNLCKKYLCWQVKDTNCTIKAQNAVLSLTTSSFYIKKYIELTKSPPAIMAVIATIAFTAANPRASAIAWKPT